MNFFPSAVPGPPDKPTVSSITRDSMTVNWEEPEHDGGSPITGYWLERKETTGKRWTRVNRDPIKPMTLGVSYKVTGLIEGSEYQFRVSAINAAGVGPPSMPSDPALARDPIGKYFKLFFSKFENIQIRTYNTLLCCMMIFFSPTWPSCTKSY